MQAVILAAGQGQRIRDYHTMPKGFIEVNDTPLIHYSLQILRSCGIENILVVTGYQADCYDQLAQTTGWFDTIYNPKFADYGNLYSFYVARNRIQDDIILIESDLIYEPRAIEALLRIEQQDAILVSGATGSGDEVFVQAQDGMMTNMSKLKADLDPSAIIGEFVGLTRLSKRACEQLVQLADQDAQLVQHGYYDEAGLVQLSARRPLPCHVIDDLQWSEIDNTDQLQRARSLFLRAPIVIGV